MMEGLMVKQLFIGFFCYSFFFPSKSVPQFFLSPLICEVEIGNRYQMATHEHDISIFIYYPQCLAG